MNVVLLGYADYFAIIYETKEQIEIRIKKSDYGVKQIKLYSFALKWNFLCDSRENINHIEKKFCGIPILDNYNYLEIHLNKNINCSISYETNKFET